MSVMHIMWLLFLYLVVTSGGVSPIGPDPHESTNSDFLITTESNTSTVLSEWYDVIQKIVVRSRRLISTFDISRMTRPKSRTRGVTESIPDAHLLRENTTPTAAIVSVTTGNMDMITKSMYPIQYTGHGKYTNCTVTKFRGQRRKLQKKRKKRRRKENVDRSVNISSVAMTVPVTTMIYKLVNGNETDGVVAGMKQYEYMEEGVSDTFNELVASAGGSPQQGHVVSETESMSTMLTLADVTTPSEISEEISIPGGGSETGDVRADRQEERLLVPGDIMLGGLFSVRSAGCGGVSVSGAGAVRAAERAVRGARGVLQGTGVSLGLRLRDDCHNHLRALHHALHFIKGSCRGGAGGATRVWGVLEGAGDAAVEVASLTRLFKLPQVSFSSSSPELSHKGRFEYFLRTVPSDLHLVRVLLHLVSSLNWTYFSVVYQDTNTAVRAWEELEWMVGSWGGVCVAARERLPPAADPALLDPLLRRLLARPLVRGVVVLGSEEVMRGLWDAAERAGRTSHFLWLWAPPLSFADPHVTKSFPAANSHEMDPPWSTTNLHIPDPSLSPINHHVNNPPLSTADPHEMHLSVGVEGGVGGVVVLVERDTGGLDDFDSSLNHKRKVSASRCESRSSGECVEPDSENGFHYVTNAVLAFAYAIKSLHESVCGGRWGVCGEMSRVGGALLLTHLRNVSFTGAGGGQFQFDVWGDGPARYRVWAGRYHRASNTRWTPIGRYQHHNLTIDLTKLESVCGDRVAVSVCAAPCGRGQGRLRAAGGDCCWTCYNCTHTQIVLEGLCVSCERGRVPDVGRTKCVPLPELPLDPRAPPTAAALLLAATGLIATGLVSYVWWRHGETAVVRASGREVSAVLLGGISVSYLVSLLLLLPPTHTLCGLQRFGTGFGFTVMYAALLTKTNRIARIFAASRKSAKRLSLISPRSQLVICALLISIQVVVLGVWELSVRSRAVVHFTARSALRVCDSFLDSRHVTSFLYPALLVLVCTVYAVITRNIPEAYNESKHIGFTMYTTCVIWLAFVPLYFGTVSHLLLRVTSLSITISLSASVTLICLFLPKVYIVLFRPSLNVRSALRPRNPALLLMAVTPCSDLTNTTPDNIAVADKIVQTEDTPVNPDVQDESLTHNPPDDQINDRVDVKFPLDANNLSVSSAGLPRFLTNASSNYEDKNNEIAIIYCKEKL